jgi:hypothetical protein
MTSDDRNHGRPTDGLQDKSRRDFARSAIATGGAVLLGPKLMAAHPEAAAAVATTVGDVYATGPAIATKSVYLYRILSSGTLAYFIERPKNIPYAMMETEIEYILTEINTGWIQPSGFQLGDIRWRKKSYFVVVVEDPKYWLAKDNAVSFTYQGGGGGNHSFKSGKDILVGSNVTRFFCINHMRKYGAQGGDVDANGEQYTVTLNHPMAVNILAHSDTGTNTGPPL